MWAVVHALALPRLVLIHTDRHARAPTPAQPLHVEAGIQGNENDRGAYMLTDVYKYPDMYLLDNHNGLVDGVFKGPLHSKPDAKEFSTPFNQAEINAAPTPAAKNKLKKYNRVQRRLRVVIEQLFGRIKQWGLVGNVVYRGDVELQGINFLLCTQLEAWIMEMRDSYPRGARWAQDMLEPWEQSGPLARWLEVDPLEQECY